MKHTGYWFLLLLCGVAALVVVFLGALSIWVGIHHQVRSGAWVPMVAGALVIALVLAVYLRLFRLRYGRMKSPESIDL
jgi:membrane protein implicated in regulation of membrane protease activity